MKTWVMLFASALLMAGCAEDEPPKPEDTDFELEQELQATDDTGIIRGVVVDGAVVPLAGATIAVQGTELSAVSNEKGAFGFSDLAAGTYFLDVSATGMVSVQQAVEVVAGDNQPPIVRILLQPDASFVAPYSETSQYSGFYQCGTSIVVICAAPNILFGEGTTEDTSTPTFFYERTPDFVQTEMSWKSTQTISPQLYFEMEAIENCSGTVLIANAEGESPLRANANRTKLDASTVGGECGIYHSVFAGDALEDQHCFGWPDNPGSPIWLRCPGVGFSIEQEFSWFLSNFYGYEPDEDWWYIEDGPSYYP